MEPECWYLREPQLVQQVRSRIVAPKKNFTMVPNAVRDELLRGQMQPVDFMVLMYFVFAFGRYSRDPLRFLDVTTRELMRALGLSNHTVGSSLDRLVRGRGALSREARRDSHGRTLTTRYRLHLEVFERPRDAADA